MISMILHSFSCSMATPSTLFVEVRNYGRTPEAKVRRYNPSRNSHQVVMSESNKLEVGAAGIPSRNFVSCENKFFCV